MKHSMTKLAWGLAVLLNLLLMVAVIGCSAATGALPIDSLIGWNLTSPAEGGQSQRQSAGDSPIIHNASVQPTKVRPGDTMLVTAEVSDSSGIKRVTANMGDIETISLSLIEGSIYRGTWQGQWLVHDTSVRDYVTTIVANNSIGKSSATDVPWRDPPPQTFERYHKENYGTANTSSTTMQDALTITFTPNVAGDFFVFARADLTNTSTSDYTEARVVYGAAPTVISTIMFYPSDPTEIRNFGAATKVSLSVQQYDFKIQFKTGGAGTAGIQAFGMSIFEVSSATEHVGGTDNSTTGETWVTEATLTFSPATVGDYLVIASMEIAGDNLNRSYLTRLTYGVGDVDQGTISRDPDVADNYDFYVIMRKLSLDTSEQTFKLQFRSEAAGKSTTYIRNARICAVRIDDLGEIATDAYLESEIENTTTNTTYMLKQGGNGDPQSTMTFDHTTSENGIRFLWGLLGGSSTSKATYGAVWEDSIPLGESTIIPNAATDYVPLYSGFHRYYSPLSHTIDLMYKTVSPATAKVKMVRLMVIRADTLNPFFDSGHATYLDVFDEASEDTVYIQGHYYYSTVPYDAVTVTYYDGADYIVASDSTADVNANGVIESQLRFPDYSAAEPGTWHAVSTVDALLTAFGQSIPSTYSANWTYSVRECEFTVTALAIPEFPTVLAGISVAGLCFGIYWWMRKRKLVHVEA